VRHPQSCARSDVDFNGGNQSSNGGLLLLREAERKLGVCWRIATTIPDRRDPNRILHTMHEMLMARVSAIACGYEDANDLDRLRHDPLMKFVVGRCPETGDPLASQPTISRMENSPSKTDAARAAVAMVDQFCASVMPGEVEMFDIDDSFVAAHGGQQTDTQRKAMMGHLGSSVDINDVYSAPALKAIRRESVIEITGTLKAPAYIFAWTSPPCVKWRSRYRGLCGLETSMRTNSQLISWDKAVAGLAPSALPRRPLRMRSGTDA
jgi:Transposase DDE domain group 1